MKIDTDYYYFDGEENPNVKRGLAYVAPNHLSVSCPSEENGRRLMDAIASRFAVYQYAPKDVVPYDERYDFFFWCNDKWNTTGGRESGDDMRYFTLTPNDRKPLDVQLADYAKLRDFVREWAGDEKMSATFSWTVKDNAEAIKSEAQRILAAIAPNEKVCYKGMHGKIRWVGGDCYFMKERARRYGYRLDWKSMCAIEKIVA